LQYFRRQGWWTPFSEIALNQDWEPFQTVPFYLTRKWTDLPGLFCFNNSFLAWLGYRSPLAGLAHRLLYLFRDGKTVLRLRSPLHRGVWLFSR
jgi:hypothetical protein